LPVVLDYGKQGGCGMSPRRDMVNWVGGYPFEMTKPEEIFDFYWVKGFGLDRLKTSAGKHECNDFYLGG
jgi:2-polyprenyl-6-hydroxyphenyl methylase/3-demethylubiquinone-9 3-methyltransferase